MEKGLTKFIVGDKVRFEAAMSIKPHAELTIETVNEDLNFYEVSYEAKGKKYRRILHFDQERSYRLIQSRTSAFAYVVQGRPHKLEIIKIEGSVDNNTGNFASAAISGYMYVALKGDFFTDYESAKKEAESIRQQEIGKLKKQIEELESLKF